MSLLALPAETRNKIYSMVIADAPKIPGWARSSFSGEFWLCPPALAKVNQQLRNEILPMWYSKKNFSIRIYPMTHSEADQVWQVFLDRFNALRTAGTATTTDASPSTSYLSRIQRLEVELWHPAVDLPLHRRLRTCTISKDLQDEYDRTGQYPLRMCNGVYIQFGGPFAKLCSHRVDCDATNWRDRGALRALLQDAIVEERRNHNDGRHTDRLELFWEMFPFHRLVDLAMMIAAECPEAARLVHIGTSFAPL